MLRGYFLDSGDLTIQFRHLNYHILGSYSFVGWLEGALQAKGEEEKQGLPPLIPHSCSGSYLRGTMTSEMDSEGSNTPDTAVGTSITGYLKTRKAD
jgi:hypothetical protein